MSEDLTAERLMQTIDELAGVQLQLDGERLRREKIETLFERMLAAMSDTLALVDARGVITRVSEAAPNLLGYAMDQMVGRAIQEIAGPHIPSSPGAMLKSGPSGQVSLETELIRADGVAVKVGLSCSVLWEAHGKIAGGMYVARDLSATELLAQLRSIQELNKFREDVVAGLSHDMKTPLSVLSGMIETLLMAQGDLDEDEERLVYQAMDRQIRRLHMLVVQFLDYTRLESGHGLSVNPEATDLAIALDRLVELSPDRSRIKLEVDDNLPKGLVDPDRFGQVVHNLISNAFKFSPPGSPVTITAGPGERCIEVSVGDQGNGIEPSEIPHLFEKFRRGVGSKVTEGTGLGLFISKALIEAQGGRIRVESSVGVGSMFTVEVPQAMDP